MKTRQAQRLLCSVSNAPCLLYFKSVYTSILSPPANDHYNITATKMGIGSYQRKIKTPFFTYC